MLKVNPRCMGCMNELSADAVLCPWCGFDNSNGQNNSHQLPVNSILAGKYLVGRAMGQGGFGITYVGLDLNLEMKVAIKEYYPEGCASREITGHSTVLPFTGQTGDVFVAGRDKFVGEAKLLAKFSGVDCIVSVKDFFKENGTAYIVMEFVEGKTLKQAAAEKGGRLAAPQALRLLEPLVDALDKVHEAGLLHRDISPDNIILQPDGRVKLLDFGAARQMSIMGEHSNSINVKHGFAPEEQYRTRGEQGPWTDIYALCATIYRLTTGQMPPQALDRLSEEALTPPTLFGAAFTPAQERAIMQGMAVRGKDRPQSMKSLHAALYGTDNTAGAPVFPLESNAIPEVPKEPVISMAIPDAPVKKDEKAPSSPKGGKPNGKLFIIGGAAALVVVGVVLILALGGKEPAAAQIVAPTPTAAVQAEQTMAPVATMAPIVTAPAPTATQASAQGPTAPPEMASGRRGNVAGNAPNLGLAAYNYEAGMTVYSNLDQNNKLYVENVATGETIKATDMGGWDINIYNDDIYFTDSDDSVYVLHDMTVGPVKVKDANARHVTIFDDKIYYLNYVTRNIHRMNLDGTGDEVLFGGKAWAPCVSEKYIAFLNMDDSSTPYAMKRDGSGLAKIGDDKADDLSIEGNYVFFINDQSNGGIHARQVFTGEDLYFNMELASDLNVYGGYLYYFRSSYEYGADMGGIYRVKYLDSGGNAVTTGEEELLCEANEAWNLTIAGEYLYFFDKDQNDSYIMYKIPLSGGRLSIVK